MKRFLQSLAVCLAMVGVSYAAVTYTPNLRLQKPGRGTANWDTILNSNWDKMDAAFPGTQNFIADAPEIYQLTSTFNGTTGRQITLPKAVDSVADYFITITPHPKALGAIGDISYLKAVDRVTVYCTQANTTDTFIIGVYYETSLAQYGNQVFRRWIVSPDLAITDHTDASVTGSLAQILTTIDGTSSEVVLPGNRNYPMAWGKSYASLAGVTFNDTARTITKAGAGFVTKGFAAGMPIHVSGTTLNDGYYRIDTVSETVITVVETPVDETIAGATVIQLAIPEYVHLVFDRGAILEDLATGYTLWMHDVPSAPPTQILSWVGDVKFSYGGNLPIFTEWFGAVADGDLVTNDYDYMQKAFDAAPMGGRIVLSSDSTKGYWVSTSMLEISDATSRRLTVEGEATIFSSTTTGTAFKVMSRSTTLKDFTIQASTGYERANSAQIGLLLMNQTGGMYDHISVKDFYTNFKLYVESAGQAPTFFETSKFFALYAADGHYGFHISTDKTAWQSFATLEFYGCAVDVDDLETDGVGVYIGPNVDLYRGYMDISVHPKGENSRGFEYHGSTTAFTGRWMGECHSREYGRNGQTGIWIGNDATRLHGAIETDWMSCPNPYVREDASTIIPTGMYAMDNKGKSSIVWTGEETVPISFVDSDYYTIKSHAVSSMTAGATTTVTTSEVHDLNPGDRAIINALNAGPAGSPVACTFTISSDQVNSTAHTLSNGDRVEFTVVTTTTGITTSRVYYVVNKDTNFFKVALTHGGTAIDLATGNGTGTYISPPAENPFHDLFEWESVEVLTTPTTTSFTVRVDSTSVADPWPTGDSASLRGGNVKFQIGINALDYIEVLIPGGRMSLLQSNDTNFNNNLFMIPAMKCHWSDELVDNDATPDISGVACYHLNNSSATTITAFDGDAFGNPMNRLLLVIHDNDNTAMNNGVALQLLGDQDVVGQTGMKQLFMLYDDEDDGLVDWHWHEIFRAYRNDIKETWANRPAKPQVGQTFICTDCKCGGSTLSYPIVSDGTNWICGNGDTSPNT